METQLQITFRNMEPSKQIEEWIREAATKLESFYSGIISCHVELAIPHRHHTKGESYHMRIDLGVPEGRIVVKREPSLGARARHLDEPELKKHTELNATHKRLRRAINDAFKAAGRRLQDYARRRRRAVKSRKPFPEARVSRLLAHEGYGFLTSDDGREIYFHKNSVLGRAFPRLEVGTKVRFVEEVGKDGPQASTVRIVPKQGTHQPTEENAA